MNNQWGQDQYGVWHLLPLFRFTACGLKVLLECKNIAYINVRGTYPDTGEVCHECRSKLTQLIIEE